MDGVVGWRRIGMSMIGDDDDDDDDDEEMYIDRLSDTLGLWLAIKRDGTTTQQTLNVQR